MNIKSRLEIYPSKDTRERAVIVGEPRALRELARALLQAADNPIGFHNIEIYKGTGHNYEVLVTRNISESEWQSMPAAADGLSFIAEYNDLQSEISAART